MHDNKTAMNAEELAAAQFSIAQFLNLRVNHSTTFTPVEPEAKAKMVFTGTHPNAEGKVHPKHVKPTDLVFEAFHTTNAQYGIYNAIQAFAKHDIEAREEHPLRSGRLVLAIDTAQDGFADKLATLFQNEGHALVETARFNTPAVTDKLAKTLRAAIPHHADGSEALSTEQAAELGHESIQTIRQVVANAGGTFRLRELQKEAQKLAASKEGPQVSDRS